MLPPRACVPSSYFLSYLDDFIAGRVTMQPLTLHSTYSRMCSWLLNQ